MRGSHVSRRGKVRLVILKVSLTEEILYYSVNHLMTFSALADRQINPDDVDGDEEVRPEFLCPYCYEEFDVTALCSHLEDEHCFEFKAAVSMTLFKQSDP